MRLTFAVMPTLTERAAGSDDHRTDGRIRRRIGDRARCQFDGAREVGGVDPVYG